MKATKLWLTHYAPKGQVTATYGYVTLENESEILDILQATGYYSSEGDEDGDTWGYYLPKGENPNLELRALSLGMRRVTPEYLEGTRRAKTLLDRSTDDDIYDDLYYGKSVIHWGEPIEITVDEAEFLRRLGLMLN